MRKFTLTTGIVLVAAAVLVLAANRSIQAHRDAEQTATDKKGPMVVHNVFFSLKDSSPAAREKLVEACKKYLTKHPGEVYFAAGPIAGDLKREVNDTNFDVALTIVFEDMKAHDMYQDAPRHLEFIKENKDSWKKVRVFDSFAH